MSKLKIMLFGAVHLCLINQATAQTLDNNAPSNGTQQDNQSKMVNDASNIASPLTSIPIQIQVLKKNGHLAEAEKLATDYLNTHPQDADVRLQLGLIQQKLQKNALAEANFSQVLSKYPNYSDARVALIRIKMAEKNNAEAKSLIDEGLKLAPGNAELLALQKKMAGSNTSVLMQSSAPVSKHSGYAQAKKAHKKLHRAHAHRKLARSSVNDISPDMKKKLALVDYYLANHKEMTALKQVNADLRYCPNDPNLLTKKGEVEIALYEYPQASRDFQKALAIKPDDKQAKNFLQEITDVNPHYNYGVNEIGLYSDNAYVQDLHSVWDYSTLSYTRDIDYGRIGGRVNYASRNGINAGQYEFDFSPRFSRNVYVDLAAAYSDQPALFAQKMARAEGYVKITSNIELSGGGQYSGLAHTYFATYTNSVGLYTANNWFSFRPLYFVPKTHNTSILYTFIARHYFSTQDHYIGISAGSGKSPDLADLRTVNFIVIKNDFVSLAYEFPILNHKVVVDASVGYQRWRYPSGLVRNLRDVGLGIKYRF